MVMYIALYSHRSFPQPQGGTSKRVNVAHHPALRCAATDNIERDSITGIIVVNESCAATERGVKR